MADDPHDPGGYGASFADVYDHWYPGGDETTIATFLRDLLDPGARVLELGVGTGRVALQLVEQGFEVTGLDASRQMLSTLAEKDRDSRVTGVHADAGDPSGWDAAGAPGPFDCVLMACNVLLNLTAAGAQQACVAGVAARLAEGGVLVSELSALAMPPIATRGLEVSSVQADSVVLIATHSDPGTGLVQGQHIELRDGSPTRLRPWSLRVATVADLDRWCATVGLHRRARHGGWDHAPCGPGDAVAISVHARRPV